ncbi:hypothetical protein D018_3195A, partial [Vibrio parahaemolyticus VP2007-007]
MNCQLIP